MKTDERPRGTGVPNRCPMLTFLTVHRALHHVEVIGTSGVGISVAWAAPAVASSISSGVNWEIDGDGLKSKDVMLVRVGDPRDKVRHGLGPVRTVKGPYGPAIDQFVEQGVQITYDDDSRAREIMVAIPDQARFLGVDLLDRPIDEVLADLSPRGVTSVRDADGAILPEAGISLFAVRDRVEAVTVGYPPPSKG